MASCCVMEIFTPKEYVLPDADQFLQHRRKAGRPRLVWTDQADYDISRRRTVPRGCPQSAFRTAPWLHQNGGRQPPLPVSACSQIDELEAVSTARRLPGRGS